MTEAKPAQGRLGIYLPESTIKKLKMLGVEIDKPVNTLINEALSFWWAKHYEKEKGPLFPEESSASVEQSSPKKAATKEAPAPLAKTSKEKTKKR